MPLLLEITFFTSATFADTDASVWADTDASVWADTMDVARISDRDYAVGTRQWEGYVGPMTPPSFQMEKSHGGYCRMGFGSVGLSPDLFVDMGIWLPPKKMSMAFFWTPDVEANRELLFQGAAHRSGMDRELVEYDLYGPDFSQNFLDESEEGYGDGVTMETVPLALALGRVQQERAVRLADSGGFPVYHKGGISGSLCGDFTSVSSGGGGKARFNCSAAHGLSAGDLVIIEGDNNEYDLGKIPQQVTAVPSSTAFEINQAFNQTAAGWFFPSGTWPLRVYNAGIPFTDVTDQTDRLVMNSTPSGEITLSGTGEINDLDGAAGRAATLLSLTLYTSLALSPSPGLSRWIDSQATVQDLLSEICDWFEHIFYIEDGTLYLINMDADNGSATLTESDHTAPEYSDEAPVALLKAEWRIRKATEDSEGGKYVDDQAKEASVFSQYGYGSQQSLTPFQSDVADVTARLSSIMTRIHMTRVRISMPMTSGLPKPGKKFTISDTGPRQAVSSVFHARNITYSFNNGKEVVTVSGEGVVS